MEFDRSNESNKMEKIRKQIEFYLSDSNIRKDKFIQALLQADDGKLEDRRYVQLEQFMKFNRIKELTSEIDDLKIALKESECLELNETSVRRRNSIDFKKNIDKCTIYVEHLPNDANHDWLTEFFLHFGLVAHVSLPRFQDSKALKGFAFVEFEEESFALRACEFFDLLSTKKDNVRSDESRKMIVSSLDNLTVGEINQEKDSLACRKRFEEDSSDVKVKRVKRNDEIKINHVQRDDFLELLQKLKIKYDEKNDQLLKLRVMSKAKWIEYKKEYFVLKKKFKSQTEQDLIHSKNDETTMKSAIKLSDSSVPKKSESKYNMEPGLIIKLEYAKSNFPKEESLLKRTLREIDGDKKTIAYIDVKPECNQCYLRFKDQQSASYYSQEVKMNELCKATILEGLEEENYWSSIMRSLLDKKTKKRPNRNEHQNNTNGHSSDSKSNIDTKKYSKQSDKEVFTDFKKGLIIRLQIDIDLNNEPTEKELKTRIKSSTNGCYIAYIDLNSSIPDLFLSSELIRKTIFIRTNSSDCAQKVIESELFKALGESIVLENEEEFNYWQHVKACSQRKQPKKAKGKSNLSED